MRDGVGVASPGTEKPRWFTRNLRYERANRRVAITSDRGRRKLAELGVRPPKSHVVGHGRRHGDRGDGLRAWRRHVLLRLDTRRRVAARRASTGTAMGDAQYGHPA